MNWTLSGWKTNIGIIFMLAVVVLEKAVVGIWEYNPAWMANIIETLKWAGTLFGTTGLGHKAVKKVQDAHVDPPQFD